MKKSVEDRRLEVLHMLFEQGTLKPVATRPLPSNRSVPSKADQARLKRLIARVEEAEEVLLYHSRQLLVTLEDIYLGQRVQLLPPYAEEGEEIYGTVWRARGDSDPCVEVAIDGATRKRDKELVLPISHLRVIGRAVPAREPEELEEPTKLDETDLKPKTMAKVIPLRSIDT